MKYLFLFTLLFSLFLGGSQAYAQFGEPDVQDKEPPRSLFNEGYRTGFGFDISLNDFGLGVGGQFRFGLDTYTEALLTLRIAGLKDPTEQTFIDYNFGFKTVPEKYQRVFGIPLYAGLKKRFFAESISDNFRVFSSLSAGPVYAFTLPYFFDANENGFRENDARIFAEYDRPEPIQDIFSGWDKAQSYWGFGGEFVIGVDFGEDFKNLSSIQFGYTMNYFKKGIQVLEPCQPNFSRIGQSPTSGMECAVGNRVTVPVYLNDGTTREVPLEKANDPLKYFGTAQITFVFGWMW